MSDNLSVHEAVANVMRDLPAIGKDGKAAAQQGGYAYRGIEQITRHAQGLLAKHGVVIVPHVTDVDVREIVVAGKPWTDTRLTVRYVVVGPDGSQLEAMTVGIGRDNSDKGANKAMTQAFKYLLLQLLCVSDAKDDTDGTTIEADAEPRHPNSDRVATVQAEMRALSDTDKADLKKYANGRSLAGAALLDDERWLELVESHIDEMKAAAS